MGKKKTNKQQATNSYNDSTNKDKQQIHSDVLGSYTGTPEDGEEPIQDADDL